MRAWLAGHDLNGQWQRQPVSGVSQAPPCCCAVRRMKQVLGVHRLCCTLRCPNRAPTTTPPSPTPSLPTKHVNWGDTFCVGVWLVCEDTRGGLGNTGNGEEWRRQDDSLVSQATAQQVKWVP